MKILKGLKIKILIHFDQSGFYFIYSIIMGNTT